MSFFMILVIVAAFLLALSHPFFRNWHDEFMCKQYKSAVTLLKDKLSQKDDEMDSLFIQLLQWKEYNREYRRLVHELFPMVENNSITNGLADLDQRFEHLYAITETKRKEYMEKLSQQDDSADYAKVVDYLMNRLTGKDIGMKAEETPILNKNRDN